MSHLPGPRVVRADGDVVFVVLQELLRKRLLLEQVRRLASELGRETRNVAGPRDQDHVVALDELRILDGGLEVPGRHDPVVLAVVAVQDLKQIQW